MGCVVAAAHEFCIQLVDAMAEASSLWMSAMPSNDMLSGFKVLQRVLRFTKQNTEAGFAMSSELVGAKNVKDFLAMPSRYAQTQTQTYVLQAQGPACGRSRPNAGLRPGQRAYALQRSVGSVEDLIRTSTC